MMQNEIILQLISDDIKQIDQLIKTMKDQGVIDSTLLQFAQLKTKSFAKSLEMLSADEQLLEGKTGVKADRNEIYTVVEQESVVQIPPSIDDLNVVESVETIDNVEVPVVEESLELTVEKIGEEAESSFGDFPIFEIEDNINAKELPELAGESTFTSKEMIIELDREVLVDDEFPVVEQEGTPTKESTISSFTEEKVLLGEQVKNQSKSVNDLFGASKTEESYQRKVDSLSRSIGINDKFLFIRELFSDGDHFNKSIEALDRCLNRKDAIEYMSANFKWTKNDASDKFIQLVKLRFPN